MFAGTDESSKEGAHLASSDRKKIRASRGFPLYPSFGESLAGKGGTDCKSAAFFSLRFSRLALRTDTIAKLASPQSFDVRSRPS